MFKRHILARTQKLLGSMRTRELLSTLPTPFTPDANAPRLRPTRSFQ